MKKNTIAICALIISLICVIPVSALETSTTKRPISVSFDIDKNYQEYTFTDDNGSETKISIRSINSVSGERYISASNAQISMSYTIWLSNNNITDAYDPYVSSSFWTVFYQNLSVNSTKKATFTAGCSRLGLSVYRYLIAEVTGDTITVTLA